MDDKLYVTKHINEFIRNKLKKSVRSDIHDTQVLNNKVKEILEDASKRADMDNKKTIMAKHL